MKTLARPQDRDELAQRLRTLRPDSVRRWGRMSPHQMVCHVGDALRMALGTKAVACPADSLPRAALKWAVLYVPWPWPGGIPTSPELDQTCGGTAPTEFAADVAEAERLMRRVAAESAAFGGRVHPVFGRMSASEWLRWAYLHTAHHLRQFGA